MAQTIKIKRSAVAGKAPAVGDLALGELALNTYDGKLYTKKDDGAASIVELSGGGGGGGGSGGGPIAETAQVILTTLTLSAGTNGLSVGPVEVAAAYAVTVPANATWVIV
jgi:hypothetical protein